MNRLQIFTLLVLANLCSAAIAQSTSSILKDAYAISKNAKTEAEYTLIIDKVTSVDLETAKPDVRTYGEQLLAWALNRRGEVRWDRVQSIEDEDAKDAIKDFEFSLKLDPNRWRAKQNMSFVHAMQGDLETAESLLDEVIEAKSDHANAYFNRGEIRYEMGKLKEAVADYDKAIGLSSAEADFYTSRAHAHFEINNMTLAIADYRHAHELESNNPNRAIDLADALQNTGRWQEAAALYRNAITNDPENVRGRLNYAWVLATSPDPSVRRGNEALKIVQSVREVNDEEQVLMIDTHAAALAETRQFDAAVRMISTSMNSVPKETRAAFEGRISLYKSGRPFRQPMPQQAREQMSATSIGTIR